MLVAEEMTCSVPWQTCMMYWLSKYVVMFRFVDQLRFKVDHNHGYS